MEKETLGVTPDGPLAEDKAAGGSEGTPQRAIGVRPIVPGPRWETAVRSEPRQRCTSLKKDLVDCRHRSERTGVAAVIAFMRDERAA
jgi:hypothetical protein